MKLILIFWVYIFIILQTDANVISIGSDLTIAIISQSNSYDRQLAKDLTSSILNQAKSIFKNNNHGVINIDYSSPDDWTIFPILSEIQQLNLDKNKWIFICNDKTRINLANLLATLQKYDHEKEFFIGHALQDQEATIIHHFAFMNDPDSFNYPNIASGFVLSAPLVHSILNRLPELHNQDVDFSIDASHEFAMFVWNNDSGLRMTDDSYFCVKKAPHCASYILEYKPCNKPVEKDQIMYAVKTCKKFHKDRIPIVKNTWARYVSKIKYYSEKYDKSIPTTNLGVPNTERGHCNKTIAILHHTGKIMKVDPKIKWLVIVDDDTILSPARLQNLLSCYNHEEDIALGERYGFRVHHPQGYNYITGGGGMVFSASLIEELTQPSVCECYSNQTPDDMFLGICLSKLGVSVVHSPAFHQARPPDYAVDYLASYEVVSFHKHWMVDPVKVYKEWFENDDKEEERRYILENREL